MGVASLVIGIIALILGFVPLCGIIALVPAIIGLILGIVDAVKKSKTGESKGMSIAGIVLCSISIIVIIGYYVMFIAAAAGSANELNNLANELNNINTNYSYNYSL